MKALVLILLGLSGLSSSAANDILNFKNNDTLHGSFKGFTDTNHLRWLSNESSQDIIFGTSELRKIIFRNGLPAEPFKHTSLITLTNGDTIPCAILSFDREFISIQTSYSGEKKIATKWLKSCQLHPLGQHVIYQGPFNQEHWLIASSSDLEGKLTEPSLTSESQPTAWEFGNFSWLNRGTPGSLILNGVELPKSFRIQFKSEASRSSNVAFIFNADFNKPDTDNRSKADQSNATTRITSQFGSCFALRTNSGATSLGMYNVLENGEASYTYLKPISGRSNFRNTNPSNASQLELRADFNKLVIAAYRDGQLVNQWSLRGIEPIPQGRGIGFNSFNSGDGYLSRISNITIASWSGVLDSAQSLQAENSDIVLLANGLDRFSGSVKSITESELHLKGQYTDISIPREEIQSVTFSTGDRRKTQKQSSQEISFHLGQRGILRAIPLGTSANSILVKHPILGELSLDFSYLTAITYDTSSALIDQWNTRLK